MNFSLPIPIQCWSFTIIHRQESSFSQLFSTFHITDFCFTFFWFDLNVHRLTKFTFLCVIYFFFCNIFFFTFSFSFCSSSLVFSNIRYASIHYSSDFNWINYSSTPDCSYYNEDNSVRSKKNFQSIFDKLNIRFDEKENKKTESVWFFKIFTIKSNNFWIFIFSWPNFSQSFIITLR